MRRGHRARPSIPMAGQIQSDHSGSNNIGNAKTATPTSASATARHGRCTRIDQSRAATVEPTANPRKKKPKTRLVDSALAPQQVDQTPRPQEFMRQRGETTRQRQPEGEAHLVAADHIVDFMVVLCCGEFVAGCVGPNVLIRQAAAYGGVLSKICSVIC